MGVHRSDAGGRHQGLRVRGPDAAGRDDPESAMRLPDEAPQHRRAERS